MSAPEAPLQRYAERCAAGDAQGALAAAHQACLVTPEIPAAHYALGARRPRPAVAAGNLGALMHISGEAETGHTLLRRSQPFSREDFAEVIAANVAAFGAARFHAGALAANRDTAPVFIVGMPRSGTSLCEQILAAHPAVHGAGERGALRELAYRLGGGNDAAAVQRRFATDYHHHQRRRQSFAFSLRLPGYGGII